MEENPEEIPTEAGWILTGNSVWGSCIRLEMERTDPCDPLYSIIESCDSRSEAYLFALQREWVGICVHASI